MTVEALRDPRFKWKPIPNQRITMRELKWTKAQNVASTY